MTPSGLVGDGFVGCLLVGGAWLAAGTLLGALNFLPLRLTVAMLVAGRSLLLPLAIQATRLALMATILASITRSFGALALLGATVGITTMRIAIIRCGI
ncbi:MAG TPA: ATP synthase subunit I [Xanthobacteraceae bacterium]